MHAIASLRRYAAAAALISAGLVVAGCSQHSGAPSQKAPAASTQASANEPAAQKQLQLYKTLVAEHKNKFAAPVGQQIVRKFPGTSAAAEVQKTLPKVQADAKAEAEHQRLANLWYYQTGNVDGLQHTATIYASPRSVHSVQLILRRHVKWGLSVYLFAPEGSKGFVCKGNCDIPMHFDGKREVWKGYLPTAGKEPAMFIKHGKRFIAAMKKAKVITMEPTLQGHGKKTLKFEVGGFNPARFKPLPKKKK
jgi:F0F1-type ATP synthase membrane subunit c/vacuolar-type H+-ATPase subunit K